MSLDTNDMDDWEFTQTFGHHAVRVGQFEQPFHSCARQHSQTKVPFKAGQTVTLGWGLCVV